MINRGFKRLILRLFGLEIYFLPLIVTAALLLLGLWVLGFWAATLEAYRNVSNR